MSTFDRWNKMAGLLNESAEPQQTVEAEETQTSTMNESDLRGMIAELAKGMLSEGMLDYIKKGDSMAHVFDPAAGWSPVKQMQWGLGLLGYLDADSFRDIDGKFGPKTKKAVERFQKQMGLKPDGVWGPKTNAAFVKAVKGQIDAGMDNPRFGTITDPSPGPSNLGTVNATKQWLESWLEHSDLDGKVLRMGRTRNKRAPAAPKAPEAPASDMTVAAADEDDFFDFLKDLPEDPSFEEIAAARGAAAAKALIGEPAPGDEPEDSDVTLPGMPDVFARGLKFTNVYGEKVLDISRDDYEKAGISKADLARANNVDKVMIS